MCLAVLKEFLPQFNIYEIGVSGDNLQLVTHLIQILDFPANGDRFDCTRALGFSPFV
jgi:hypothetical protein